MNKKNKRIGIVTTFWSLNYGAVIQAYAMQKFLESNGYDVVFVNYREHAIASPRASIKEKLANAIINKKIASLFQSFSIRLQSKIWNGKYSKQIRCRNELFSSFVNNYLALGDECSQYDSLSTVYRDVSCYICGSDQIWNPLVYGYSDYHFLSFVKETKKISYAASIAKQDLSFNDCKNIVERITDFSAISVREEVSKEALKAFDPSLSIRTVLDPTFLLSKDKWKRLFPNKIDGKYILVYMLSYNQLNNNIKRWINTIAKEKKLKVVTLPFSERLYTESVTWEKRFDVSPDIFITLLLNSTLVVTNSFHATALSIINNKQFVVADGQDKHETQSRIDNILLQYGLSSRYFQYIINDMREIDYSSINIEIEKRANADGNWLLKAIEG